MASFEVRTISDPAAAPFDAVLALYDAVGWTAYTRAPEVLRAALAGSSFVAAAFGEEQMIGLVRAISDDATICYVQDVLVHPDARRSGVGAALMAAVGARFAPVRQHVLLTDDEAGQRSFYESLGFAEARDHGAGALRAFVRFG
jgi:GNAT superfamily N-acetyltransferase